MHQALKDAITISKTLLRNGYDAHVINAPLQEHLLENAKQPTVDIACEPDLDTLIKLFPKAVPLQDKRALAALEENGFTKCGIIHVEDGTPRIAYQKMSLTLPLRRD